MTKGRELNPRWSTWGTCSPTPTPRGIWGGPILGWERGRPAEGEVPRKANPSVLQKVRPAPAPLLGPARLARPQDKPLPWVLGGGLLPPGLLRASGTSLLFFEQLGSRRWLGSAVATAQDSWCRRPFAGHELV